MTGLDLLNELQRLQRDGIDISNINVVVHYTEYDDSIPYDIGRDREIYVGSVDVEDGEIRLGW